MSDPVAPLADWQQGDVCADIESIPFLADLQNFGEFGSRGAVVISQTCDVVRDAEIKPFIQLAALVAATPTEWDEVAKFGRPRYAVVPLLRETGLLADLDMVITVDKMALKDLNPLRGCPSVSDQQAFAYALARHRNRFAFPDDCSRGLAKLRNWVKSKGKSAGTFGSFLNGIEQFRIWADDLEKPAEVEILCVLEKDPGADIRDTWIKAASPRIADLVKGWCPNCSVLVQTPDELTLSDYRRFVRLDFDALTLQMSDDADVDDG